MQRSNASGHILTEIHLSRGREGDCKGGRGVKSIGCQVLFVRLCSE